MAWEVEFYSDKVSDSIQTWPLRIKAKFTRIIELIEEVGPEEVGMPHVKPLGRGLFEIRAKGEEGIGRAPFCMVPGKIIIILSGFIKKTEKMPARELELVRNRMKEVKKQ